MAYIKTNWVNNETELNAQNMNHIEDGIENAYGHQLLAVADEAPAECVEGDQYYNRTTAKIYTATGTNTWGTDGEDPEEDVFYVVMETQNIFTYNGQELISVGGGAGGQIAISETEPTEEEILWINPEDTPSGSLNPITNTYSEATDKGYSCNYLNGSVVEEGSNANGTYIKYGNGIMICAKSVSQSLTFNDTWGSLYESSLSLGNWAQEFNAAPIVNATNISASGILVESFNPAPTKTSAGSIYLARPTSGTHQANINLIAIGKWK